MPAVIVDEIVAFDELIDTSLQNILGTPAYGKERLAVHLPLSMGGLGIPILAITADSAFVWSVGASWALQPNIHPRNGFHATCDMLSKHGVDVPVLAQKSSSAVSPLLFKPKEFNQCDLLLTINGNICSNLSATSDPRSNVIRAGRSCKGASYWLTTPPNLFFGSVIEPSAFRLLLKYSIGMPLFSDVRNCPDCGKTMDKFGHHALSCRKASGAIEKHNSIVNSIFLQMKAAGINCCSEAFNPMKDCRQRPGDIYMPEFDVRGDAFFDVSVISIGSDSYYARAAKSKLSGSEIRYQSKMSKYPDLGFRFKPLVLESTGGWHPYSIGFLKILSVHIAARTNKSAIESLNALLSVSSFCLQRHQGAMLVRRCLGVN